MIKSLFKYLPPRIEFFDNFYLRASTRNALNDPFECSPSANLWAKYVYKKNDINTEELNTLLNDGIDPTLEDLIFINHGIISLTETDDNLLMWSHYAQQHQGIVIEFDYNNLFFKDIMSDNGRSYDKRLHRVLYRKERFSDYEINNPSSLRELFFYKSDEWEYEKEHRLLLNLKLAHMALLPKSFYIDDSFDVIDFNDKFYEIKLDYIVKDALYFYRVPHDAIKSVIFGCNVDENFKKSVINKVKSNTYLSHVKLKEATINQQDYKLDFRMITDFV